MNSSSLTIGSNSQRQPVELRAQAWRLRERVALRAGLALIAWGRRQDEHRTHAAMYHRRHNQQVAHRVRADEYQRIALLAQPLI